MNYMSSYIVLEEAGQYSIANILETHKNNLVVEHANIAGRKKAKLEQQLFALNSCKDMNKYHDEVEIIANTLDLEIVAELIDETTSLTLDESVELYFSKEATEQERIALLFALNKHISFYNLGRGVFRKCSAEEIQQRQELIAKNLAEAILLADYTNDLINQKAPDSWSNLDIIKLINKPDKNSLEHKALQQASKELHLSILEVCVNAGLINDIANYFVQTFLKETFPHGINTTVLPNSAPIDISNLEHNQALQVFSIDDSTTTEIDDAFSVEALGDKYRIGVHIAAPALDSSLTHLVSENLSTIYYPGHKITMLPEEVIAKYTLDAGKTTPVVSIYFVIDNEFNIAEYYSKLETITIKANLRIEELEAIFNHDSLDFQHNYHFEHELKLLYKFAIKLEEQRGKPSVNSIAPDYNFSFVDDKIIIKPRERGNPIDILVSELMILGNCSWGRLLTNAFIPAIYRVKQHNYPVKMTTTPDSHIGLNVDYYTWASSPLRRSVDYVNQHQIISLIRRNKDYYTEVSPIMASVVENFDAQYGKYLAFQDKMEKYWSLKYLIQENITEMVGVFVYKSKIHLMGIPLNIDGQGLIKNKDAGEHIKVLINNINLATLTFDFKLVELTT